MEKIKIIFKFILLNINKELKKKLFFLFSIMLIAALMEVGSIASLIPFLQNVLFVETTEEILVFDNLFNNFEIYNKYRFTFITIFFISFILLSLFVRLYLLKLMFRFTRELGYFFASQIFNKIVNLNYLNFTKESSSKYLSILETKVDKIVDMVHNGVEILSSIIILSFILVALLIINTEITLLIFAFFLVCYYFLFRRYKKKMNKVGEDYSIGLSGRMKNVQEIFGSFRLLKLDQLKSKIFFTNRFLNLDFKIRSALEIINFLGNFPRFLVEGIAIVVISVLAFFLIKFEVYEQEIIILSLGVIGFSAQRLLPLIQKIYFSSSYLISCKDAAYDGIEFLLNKDLEEKNSLKVSEDKIIKLNDSIKLKNVSFTYSTKNENKIFNNVNLEIKKNSKVCILGKTGSGKSTFVDLIVGLLKPESGEVYIDASNIENVLQSWHNQISYVPQSTFLLDSTILENIAFGINRNDIDLSKVENSIKLAGLKEFIDTLPEKYNSRIGERGIQLSGGQIQRLGLARAFYKEFEVLILDESTNALDSDTENEIYNNIKKILKDKTIIVITHKKELAKNFDKVIRINDGLIEIN